MDNEKLIGATESETLEWKSSFAQLNKIIETISAFSNTKGGKIVVGVNGAGKILGVTIGKDTIEQVINKIISNTEPKIYPDISVRNTDGKNLVIHKYQDIVNSLNDTKVSIERELLTRKNINTS